MVASQILETRMSQLNRRQLALGYLALLVTALLPLAVIRHLPLHDYPNHLARMHILVEAGSNPVLNRYYEIDWQILPNLLMDISVPLLAHLVPVEDATRLFVALVMILMTSGTVALFAALHGRLSWWPLLAFLFLYSRVMLFGHLNYLAGVGLFLWAFAAWIFWRDRTAIFRVPVFALVATVLFFSHLYALGLYGICVAGFELAHFRARYAGLRDLLREGAVVAAQFVIPIYLLVAESPTAGSATVFLYDPLDQFLRNKVRAVYQLTANYYSTFDRATFVLLAGGFAAAVALGWVAIDRRMWLPLVLLVIAFLIMPNQLFASNLADFRLPVALVLVLIASSAPVRLPFARLVMAALAALLVLRMGLITERWSDFDAVYDRYLEAIQQVPEGSRLITAVAEPSPELPQLEPTLMYVNALAVLERSAFEPAVFADRGKQPIAVTEACREAYEELWRVWSSPAAALTDLAPSLKRTGGNGSDDMLFAYDYLLLLYPEGDANPAPEVLEQIETTPLFHLYRVVEHASRRTGQKSAFDSC